MNIIVLGNRVGALTISRPQASARTLFAQYNRLPNERVMSVGLLGRLIALFRAPHTVVLNVAWALMRATKEEKGEQA